MGRFSKILNREITEDEVFQIDNYIYSKTYSDCTSNDTDINHVLRIKFKFDFSDLDSKGRIIYMEELENDHWNTNALGVMGEDEYFFTSVSSQILNRLV